MTTIGFVGYGPINSALARFAIHAGYDVIISNSRGPQTLTEEVAALGDHARAAIAEEAVLAADIVSVSVPLHVLGTLPAAGFDGKITIDTNNYYPQRNGQIPELDTRELTSSQYVLRHLPGARLVKALYNLDLYHLQNGPRPAGSPERWALPIAADDEDAKAGVAAFVERIGFDAVDCGTLADSWRIQGGTPVYVLPYIGTFPEGTFEQRQQWFRSEHTARVGADDVRRLAAQADPDGRPCALTDDLPREFTAR